MAWNLPGVDYSAPAPSYSWQSTLPAAPASGGTPTSAGSGPINPNAINPMAASPTAGASGGGGGMDWGEYFNSQAETLKQQAAATAAQLEYQRWRTQLIDVPMLDIEKDRLAFQKAQQAAQEAYQQKDLELRTGQVTGTFGGAPTEQAREFQSNLGMQALNLIGSLRGPQNAFQQQNVLSGMNQLGISNAVGALSGMSGIPQFQAPHALSMPATIGSLVGQATGNPMNAGAGAYQPFMPNADPAATVSALPNPNKIVGRNYNEMDPDTQAFLLSAYGARGDSDKSVLATIAAGLPQWRAPNAGTVVG